MVYVNRFGSHRCGTAIRYGCVPGTSRSGSEGSARTGAPGPSGDVRRPRRVVESPSPARSPGSPQAAGRRRGDCREDKTDVFDFPCPSRNVDKATKRKKQKSKVWLRVWKVISKMLEENEKFRSRLMACSQCNGEGSDMNQSSQNEASLLDREESIFGWV